VLFEVSARRARRVEVEAVECEPQNIIAVEDAVPAQTVNRTQHRISIKSRTITLEVKTSLNSGFVFTMSVTHVTRMQTNSLKSIMPDPSTSIISKSLSVYGEGWIPSAAQKSTFATSGLRVERRKPRSNSREETNRKGY